MNALIKGAEIDFDMKFNRDNLSDCITARLIGQREFYKEFYMDNGPLSSGDMIEDARRFLEEGCYKLDVGDVCVMAAANAMPANINIFEQHGDEAVLVRTPATRVHEGIPIDIYLRYKRSSPEHYDAVVEMTEKEIEEEISRREKLEERRQDKMEEIQGNQEEMDESLEDAVVRRIMGAPLKRNVKIKRHSIDYQQFVGVPIEEVEQLPWDIDGTKVYKMINVNINNQNDLLMDGRCWKTNTCTVKKENIVRRLAKCKGALICQNNECSKFTSEGIRNVSVFHRHDMHPGIPACGICDYIATV